MFEGSEIRASEGLKSADKTRRFGVWLLTCPGALENKRIRREDRLGYEVITPFQRAIGVRYSRGRKHRFPDSKGGYGGFGPCGPPRRIPDILKDHINAGPVPRRRLKIRAGRTNLLAHSTGYVLLWAPHIQYRSVAGSAYYVGSVFIKNSSFD